MFATPLAFDIVAKEDASTLSLLKGQERDQIKYGCKVRPDGKPGEPAKQPPYNFGTTQIQLFLEVSWGKISG